MPDNQNNFYDSQNYNVDIIKIYNDFISEIDSIRSLTNMTNIDTALDLNNHALKIKHNAKPQESRCHAFYRLIGLPACNSESGIYSPGFHLKEQDDKFESKKTVAKGISKDLYQRMLAREQADTSFKKIFALKDVQASALALGSKRIRKFADPLGESDDPLDAKDITYTVDKRSEDIDLTTLIDENNEPINAGSEALKLAKARRHILKPFIVNPVIDLTVYPSERRISVPFIEKYFETKIANDKFLRRPYIEFVCRTRFNGKNDKDKLTQAQENLITTIENSETLKDLAIIQQVANGFKTNEKIQFTKFFDIIRSMLLQLYKSISKIDEISHDTFWVPIPDKNGPEFGCVTRDIISGDINNKPNDNDIADKQTVDKWIEFNSKRLNVHVTSVNRFAFESVQLTPDDSSGYGNVNASDLGHALDVRNAKCEEANDSLKIIEIIMGEFSGLGLGDIIAIYSALWLIDKKYLIGLLDDDAFERMKLVPELKNDPEISVRAGSAESLAEFEKKVKELFELMDKVYIDISSNNSNAYST